MTSASIESPEDFWELSRMADTAEECLTSLRFGSHWLLKKTLRDRYGIITSNREADIKAARKLCDEYISRQRYANIT